MKTFLRFLKILKIISLEIEEYLDFLGLLKFWIILTLVTTYGVVSGSL
jgi:hypothetical protein